MNSEEKILHSPQKDAGINSAPNSNEDSPILHSYKRDSLEYLRSASGFTDNVSDEEALKLAEYKEKISYFNKERMLVLFAIAFVVFAFVIFVIPFVFKNKTNSNNVPLNNPLPSKFFSVDTKIILEIKGDFNQKDFLANVPRVKDNTVSEFVPYVNGSQIKKTAFIDLLNPRFKIFDAYVQEDFLYGAIGTLDSKQERFVIFKLKDNIIETEKTLLQMEKTLYSDIKQLLGVATDKSDTNIEFRAFIDSSKITEPARVLESVKRENVIVYGFVDNKYIVFTQSLNSFSILRSKLITGF
jgi:hypothetical protein